MIKGWKISENYCFEIALFHKVMADHNWRFSFETEFITKKIGDHCPRFQTILILFKWTIFEIGIYNINHLEEDADWV